MNKELVIDILQEKKGLEEALSNFLVDIRENQDKRKYYHFLVDEEKIYYYSDYNKKINCNGIEITTGKWINDFKNKSKGKDEEYLKDHFLEIFYCKINYIKVLKEKIKRLQKRLYKQFKSVA
ncbi:hypothetical protein [Clostridium perfringens]|uniref:hypothetical protein n=1 Tax=Clostridium perfringens TaxID=1502 RepID=UPI0024BBFB76|nr:hypothetical protein [Clostridium perfringens]